MRYLLLNTNIEVVRLVTRDLRSVIFSASTRKKGLCQVLSAKQAENKSTVNLSSPLLSQVLSWPSEMARRRWPCWWGAPPVSGAQEVFNKSTDRSRHDFAINSAPKPEKRINYFSSFASGISDRLISTFPFSNDLQLSSLQSAVLMCDDINIPLFVFTDCQVNLLNITLSPALYSPLANSWNSKLKAGEFPECELGECISINNVNQLIIILLSLLF